MSEWTTPGQLKMLFHRIADGDIAAFSELYRGYHAHLYSIAVVYSRDKQLAEDTVQEIFLKVWERRRELTLIDDPEAWLNTAARYQIKNALYKELKKTEFLTRLTADTRDEKTLPNDSIITRQQKELIERTIAALPPQQLKVYRLVREEGLSYAEIAEQLDIGRESVKEHMARALKFLHKALAKQKDLLSILVYYFFNN